MLNEVKHPNTKKDCFQIQQSVSKGDSKDGEIVRKNLFQLIDAQKLKQHERRIFAVNFALNFKLLQKDYNNFLLNELDASAIKEMKDKYKSNFYELIKITNREIFFSAITRNRKDLAISLRDSLVNDDLPIFYHDSHLKKSGLEKDILYVAALLFTARENKLKKLGRIQQAIRWRFEAMNAKNYAHEIYIREISAREKEASLTISKSGKAGAAVKHKNDYLNKYKVMEYQAKYPRRSGGRKMQAKHTIFMLELKVTPRTGEKWIKEWDDASGDIYKWYEKFRKKGNPVEMEAIWCMAAALAHPEMDAEWLMAEHNGERLSGKQPFGSGHPYGSFEFVQQVIQIFDGLYHKS